MTRPAKSIEQYRLSEAIKHLRQMDKAGCGCGVSIRIVLAELDALPMRLREWMERAVVAGITSNPEDTPSVIVSRLLATEAARGTPGEGAK